MADIQLPNNLPHENWFLNYWRPALCWIYGAICLFDFIIAPTGNIIASYYFKFPYLQWVPITTQGSGILHVSMGVIVGATSYGRSQENLQKIKNMPDFSQSITPNSVIPDPPAPMPTASPK